MGTRIIVRKPESIYRIDGEIQNGTFSGRWHFSFGRYNDPDHMSFGTLRVFNDDTLSPGAVWPLHRHKEIEVVTYCVDGEFRHADEHGEGGVLKKGWVQHTTIGQGMYHAEINNRRDAPMRFIQMWFQPSEYGLTPSVEQRVVDRKEQTNRLLPLVSNVHEDALRIRSDARVFSCTLRKNRAVSHFVQGNRGAYLYLLEGGPVSVDTHPVAPLGAAKIVGETDIQITTRHDAELLLVDVLMEL